MTGGATGNVGLWHSLVCLCKTFMNELPHLPAVCCYAGNVATVTKRINPEKECKVAGGTWDGRKYSDSLQKQVSRVRYIKGLRLGLFPSAQLSVDTSNPAVFC